MVAGRRPSRIHAGPIVPVISLGHSAPLRHLYTTEARVFVVPLDGSGPGEPVTVDVPDLSPKMGFPNMGPAVVWLPNPAAQG
jgi:hypothetical protein